MHGRAAFEHATYQGVGANSACLLIPLPCYRNLYCPDVVWPSGLARELVAVCVCVCVCVCVSVGMVWWHGVVVVGCRREAVAGLHKQQCRTLAERGQLCSYDTLDRVISGTWCCIDQRGSVLHRLANRSPLAWCLFIATIGLTVHRT
jgi:hypothetical protein